MVRSRFPPHDAELGAESWDGVPVQRIETHDFTHVADYGDPIEAAAILGRIYGPDAERYMRDCGQSTAAHRLRICYGQIIK